MRCAWTGDNCERATGFSARRIATWRARRKRMLGRHRNAARDLHTYSNRALVDGDHECEDRCVSRSMRDIVDARRARFDSRDIQRPCGILILARMPRTCGMRPDQEEGSGRGIRKRDQEAGSGGAAARRALAARIGTELHVRPVARPLPAPREIASTDRAALGRQIGLGAHGDRKTLWSRNARPRRRPLRPCAGSRSSAPAP